MKKRFTRGGGAPLALTLIALILSLAAAFEEYLGRFIYNKAFDKETDKIFLSDITGIFTMERDSVNVIRVYTEKAFIMALVAFIAFIVLVASARKKKIVSGEAWMMIITSAACAIEPVMYMIYFFSNGLYKNFSDSNDGVRFRSFYGFLIYALPLLAAFLIIIAGFVLLIRLAREKAAEIITDDTAAAEENDTYPAVSQTPIPQPQTEAAIPEVVMPVAVMPQGMQINEAPAVDNEAENGEAIPSADIAPAEAEMPQVQPIITHEPEQEEQKVFCGHCGQQLDPSAKFCNNCGTKR